jgi:superfamily II DNA or RNA helicase/ribosomal protein S17E
MLININTNVYNTDFSNINYETNNIYFIKEPYKNDEIIFNITPNIFTPYEYQLDAVNKIKDNFIINHRSILAIPCGCGKTYISYLISLNYKKIIIISPLIEFASQNLSKYIEYGYNENNTILINSDGIRDIDIIKTKIKENEKLLISSTFKSMDIINECLDLFDKDTLFIIDEFHNLSKNNISDKDDDIYKLLITNHKILFMSATPRIYDIEYLDDDEKILNDDDKISNEDEDDESIIDYDCKFDELFGKIVYNMSLRDAIINKYITDYKIWLPSIHENKDKLKEELSIYDIDDDIKNRCDYLFSCLSNNGSRKTIIYCKDTNDMNNMINSINKLNDFYNLDIDIYSISCENTNKERKNILKSFSENDYKIQLLFNIKILNECIDIPSCDSIYISYPPKNKITTVQRINRATRINKNNSYKIANIYIWCDEYEEILETLSSIKEYDSIFKDKIKINSANFYNNKNEIYIKIINEDIETLNKYIIGVKEFKCLTWDEKLKQVEEYIIEYNILPSYESKDNNIKVFGKWLSRQKENYKYNKCIMKNEYIKKIWEEFIEKYKEYFKTDIEKWKENLNKLENYIIENKKLPSTTDKDNNIKSLACWVLTSQKTKYKNNKGIMKNEEIRKKWEDFIEKYKEYFKSDIEKWKENLNKLENYIIENENLPSSESKNKDIKYLGCWLQLQKHNYKNNKGIIIDIEIRKKYEEFIEKYSDLFKTDIEKWKENLKLVEDYIIKNEKLPSSTDKKKDIKYLGSWLVKQKQNYKNNECIIKLNEEIKKQWEEFMEKYSDLFKTDIEKWKENLKLVEDYIIKNEKLPSNKNKDIKDIKILGEWLSCQKQNYKNNECIIKLNEKIKKEWEEFIEKYNDLFKTNIELWYDKFNLVKDYVIKNNILPSKESKDDNTKILGNWIGSQKSKYKKNIEIMKNEQIKKEWEEFIEKYSDLFKTYEEIWNENLVKLEEFINKYNKLPSITDKDINNKKLGAWLSQQNEKYKNNDKCMKNEEIRTSWEKIIEKYSHLFKKRNEYWNENLIKLEEFINKYNKLPSAENKDRNIKYLGCWLSHQKDCYKNNESIMKNEEIKKQWEEFIEKYIDLFKSNEELWSDNLKKLEEFINKYNKLPSNKNKDIDIKVLGGWLSNQKHKYKNNKHMMKDEEIRKQWEEFIEKYKELF